MHAAAIDLFCGIGGLTKGLSLAGIDVLAGFDNDPSCRFAYEANNKATFICSDISTLSARDITNLYPKDSITILAGCAPCQPFSRYSSKYRKDGWKDGKWKLLYSFSRLIKESSPDVIVMENVPNLAKQKVFLDFLYSLTEAGFYKPFAQVIHCPEYGIDNISESVLRRCCPSITSDSGESFVFTRTILPVK